MKKVNLLSKTEMKKVMGGVVQPEMEGDACLFVVTYDNGTVVNHVRWMEGGSTGANSLCVALIIDESVKIKGCRYDCAADGIGN
jgi:hypothetical protein